MSNYQFVQNASVAVKTQTDTAWRAVGVNKGMKKSLKAEEKARDQLSPYQGALSSKWRKFGWSETYTLEGKGGGIDTVGGGLLLPESDPFMRSCGMIYRKGYDIKIDNVVGSAGFAVGDTLNSGATALGTILDVMVEGSVTTLRVVKETLPTAPADNDVLTASNGTTAQVNGAVSEVQVYYRTSDYSEMDALQIRTIEDARLKLSAGVRGNCKYTTDGFGLLEYSLTGLYVENPTDVTPIDPIVSLLVPPITDGARIRIGSLNMDASEHAVQKFDFDCGNKVDYVPAQQQANGVAAVAISGLTPTGNISLTVPSYAEFNPYAMIRDSETLRISHSVGSTAGNQITVVIPNAQFGLPDDSGDTVGIATYNLQFSARRDPNNTVPPFYFMFH